jgi:hypothetical protein
MSLVNFQLTHPVGPVPLEPGILSGGYMHTESVTLDFSSGLGIHYMGSEHLSRPKIRYGDYDSDWQSGKYAWESWEAFERFLEKEEETGSIELRKVKAITGAERYVKRTQYVCACAGTGGQKGYTKKNLDWDRKVKSKLTECPCSLIVKTYHGVDDVHHVLGNYRADHNHPMGQDNLKYTRLSLKTRNWIAAMVRGKVDSGHIVRISCFEV